MVTPNQMPKRQSKVRQQLVASLIETQQASWKRKVWAKDEDGELKEATVTVTRDALRYPLAQNVSDRNVEALAERWL